MSCKKAFAFDGVPDSLGFGTLSDDGEGGLFGSVNFQGCAAIQLNPATVNAVGNIGEPVNGSLSIALNPVTVNAVGNIGEPVNGTAAIQLNPVTVNAVGNIGEPVNGSLSIALNSATVNAVAKVYNFDRDISLQGSIKIQNENLNLILSLDSIGLSSSISIGNLAFNSSFESAIVSEQI